VSLEVHTVETPGLGDRSYPATDGRVAVVVDPQRDIDRVLALADGLGVRITPGFAPFDNGPSSLRRCERG
jgi:hypothetical protein